MSVKTDSPELLKAQLNALSRLIPLLYFILVANAWVLSYSFFGNAPNWLTIYVPLALTTICALRLVVWWRKRGALLTDQRAAVELRRTNKMAVIMGPGFTLWGFALFSYGDAYAQAHIGMFLLIAMLGSMLCLIHLRSAALILAATVALPFAIFFASTGVTSLVGIAINVMMVTVAGVIIILIQYRDFMRMVEAQKQTELLSDENLRLANLDSLTELPNRRAFFSRLNEAFDYAKTTGTRLALGIIDLDGFKPVNDLYGHATGDRLLVEVAARLSSLNSQQEVYFISRLGGDEFAYIVTDAAGDEALVAQGDKITADQPRPRPRLARTVHPGGRTRRHHRPAYPPAAAQGARGRLLLVRGCQAVLQPVGARSQLSRSNAVHRQHHREQQFRCPQA